MTDAEIDRRISELAELRKNAANGSCGVARHKLREAAEHEAELLELKRCRAEVKQLTIEKKRWRDGLKAAMPADVHNVPTLEDAVDSITENRRNLQAEVERYRAALKECAIHGCAGAAAALKGDE